MRTDIGGRRAAPLRAAAAALCLAAAPAEAATVEAMRLGVDGVRTRLVIETDGRVAARAFTLADPYRVVVDLPAASWTPRLRSPAPAGPVTGLRHGRFERGVLRVVLDLDRPVRVAAPFWLAPPAGSRRHRLVLDMTPTDRESFVRDYRARAAGRRAPPPPPAPPPRARGGKRLIVVDAGHGGIDPGAVSRSGRPEKGVVLAHARELRRQLVRTGRYRVAMTRDSDVYVALRTRKARAVGADLFLSLHADSIGRPSVRGASVYTLSERASDRQAAAAAARENRSDVIAGIDLDRHSRAVAPTLFDLSQRAAKTRSAEFANLLVHEMSKVRKMLRNTHRSAGFVVLKAPNFRDGNVPAVLVELGYLSNRRDERMLLSASERRKVSAAIVRAVDRFFAGGGRAR